MWSPLLNCLFLSIQGNRENSSNTDHRDVEKTLRERELKFRSVWENSPDGMRLTDENGIIIDVNQAFCQLVEMSYNELLGQSLTIAHKESNREYILKRYCEQFAAGDLETHFDTTIELCTGRIIDVELTNSFIELDDKTLLLSIYRDIADLKKAEESLVQERIHLNSLLKQERLLFEIASRLHSGDSLYDVLDELMVKTAETLGIHQVNLYPLNSRFKKVLRFGIKTSKRNHPRKKDDKSFPYTSIAILKERIKQGISYVFSSRTEIDEDVRNFFLSRNIRAIMLFPIRISNQSMGVLCFEQNQAYEWNPELYELCNTIAEIISNACEKGFYFQARLTAEKNRTEAIEMLEKTSRLASIGLMAASIIHEINQSLGLIEFSVENILFWDERNKGIVPEVFMNKIRKISDSAKRIDDIMQHIRSFWVRPGTILEKTIDLNEAVKKALSLLTRQIHAHGIELETMIESVPLSIQGSFISIEQIVINLVVNSIQAFDFVKNPDKKIYVVTRSENNHAFLEIQDTAIGIPDGIGDKLFDPLFTTKKNKEGMGLGLTIAKLFVSEHRGTIAGKNNEHGGATFTIQFPLFTPEEDKINGNTSG